MALFPVGPLPASVYWRRRLVMLVLLVVAVLLLRSLVDGSPKTTAGAGATPTSTSTNRAGTPTPTPSRSAVRAALLTCTDSALTLSVRSDAKTYPAGAKPKLTITVTNTSATACRRDLGGKQVELLVYSGQDRIWSSDDCGDTTSTSVQTLKAHASLETAMTWPGTRSRRGCEGDKPEARPGTYYVKARIGTLRTSGAVFRLQE